MKEKSHMPARRRGTGESVNKKRPQMLFASYGDGERPIIIREGDRRQPRVTRITASTPTSNTEQRLATAA